MAEVWPGVSGEDLFELSSNELETEAGDDRAFDRVVVADTTALTRSEEKSQRLPTTKKEPKGKAKAAVKKKERKKKGAAVTISAADMSAYPRPQLSYARLAADAIKATADNKATVGDIYTWIVEKYPYYRVGAPWWKNCIRHNLSMKKCFIRTVSELGNYWSLDQDEAIKLFSAKCNPASWHNGKGGGKKRRASDPSGLPKAKSAKSSHGSKKASGAATSSTSARAGGERPRSAGSEARVSIGTQTEYLSVACQTEISCFSVRADVDAQLAGADANGDEGTSHLVSFARDDMVYSPLQTAPVILRGPRVITGPAPMASNQSKQPMMAMEGYTYPGDLEADLEGSFLKDIESFGDDDDDDSSSSADNLDSLRSDPFSQSWGGFPSNFANNKEESKNPFI